MLDCKHPSKDSKTRMGKPLVHMIPSQEAKFRARLSNSAATSDSEGLRRKQNKNGVKNGVKNGTIAPVIWKGKQPPATSRRMTKGNIVKRSSTNASNGSSKTSKASNESGSCSFVHSNASLSSSDEPKMTLSSEESLSTVVSDSISTSSLSSSSEVRNAIQNFQQGIEITRKTYESSRGVSSSSSMMLMPKTNNEAKHTAAKKSINVEIALEPMNGGHGNTIEGNDKGNGTEQEAPKYGDETTISSMSYRSTSFGSINHSTSRENQGVIPRFEVLLDDIPEKEIEPVVTALDSPKIEGEVLTKLGNVSDNFNPKEDQNGFEVDFSSIQEPPDAINPRLATTRRDSRPTKNSTTRASSSHFFSAMDRHVATRRRRRPHRIEKLVHSIEVVKSSKVEDDAVLVQEDAISVLSDTNISQKALATSISNSNRVLSPSTTKRVRQSLSNIAASFVVPPSPKTNRIKKKVYLISAGELVVNEVEEYEAIELRETGSVILKPSSEQKEKEAAALLSIETPREAAKKPYRLVRLDDSNVAAVFQRNRSKASSKSLIAKGFRRKYKRSKSASAFSQNPVKVISEVESTLAVELIRTPTTFGSSKAFSYDENVEDTIIKQESPPPSPIPPVDSLHIADDNNDIEIVAPPKRGLNTSVDTVPPVSEGPIERIVSICKLNVKDDAIETTSQLEFLPSKESSTLPQKFEHVVEIPSNRVEGLIDMTRVNSSSTQSVASIPSNSSTKSCTDPPSRYVAVHTHEVDPVVETKAIAPKYGDQLVYIGSEQSNQKVAKTIVIPRIPASKRDTSSKKNDASIMRSFYEVDEKSPTSSKESSRKVKIQVQAVQKPDEVVKNIEVSSVATPTSTESQGKVSTLIKKHSTMVVKKTTPIGMVVKKPALTNSSEQEISLDSPSDLKHVVHVNVLGIAGIVVDRKKCRDVTGDDRSPSPPDQMTAVVGISECYQESTDDVTTFSSALVHAPTAKASNDEVKSPNDVQRQIAVWASNQKGETPGSIVKSKILDLKSTDENRSKRVPKFLDLKVALAKSSDSIHHTAVVIGKACIEITEDMMSGVHTRTLDLPVTQAFEKDPLSSSAILLRTSSKPQNDFRKLCIEEFCDMKDEIKDGLTSAYAIDPLGDSMIRVQVEVKDVTSTPNQKDIKRYGSSTNRTTATERSDESSIPSGAAAEETEGQDMYSEPLEFPTQFDEVAAFHAVSRKENPLSEEPEDPGCKMFGRKFCLPNYTSRSSAGLASRIDGRIENIAERVLSRGCTGRNRDDSSLIGDNTYYTGATGTTQGKMLEESAVGSVPFLNELQDFAKEFAVSSGGYFFPEDYEGIDERIFSRDDDDVSTDYTMSTVRDNDGGESWKKKNDDDDSTYSSREGSDNGLEDYRLVDHDEPIQFGGFNGNRRVMSESNKFDLGTKTNQRLGMGRSFNSYTRQEAAGQLEARCDGDDEDSSAKAKPALVDDIVDEDNKSGIHLKRENSGKPSLPSVVENIAEVLSIGGKACGYFSADDVDPKGSTTLVWNQRTGKVEIPQTVDQNDLQSVGDLTAITLEKNEMRETNRKLLLKRLGLPKEILAWGRTKAEMANEEEGSQSEIKRSKSGAASEKPEDYFAEYEGGRAEGVSLIYRGSNELIKQDDDINEEEAQKDQDNPLTKISGKDESEIESV